MASNFIIIYDDYLALENKIDDIKNGFNITSEQITYDLTDDGIYSLIDELNTISLFDDSKFIVVKNSEEILEKSNKSFLELLKAMNDQNSSNILILTFQEQIPYGNEQFQKLKQFSSVFEIKSKNINFDEYALKSFDEAGYKIELDTLKLLISYVDNLACLKIYIDQLLCYKYDTKKIENKDVMMIVSEPLDDNIYSLIDSVLANNKKLMVKGYHDLKIRNVSASSIVSMLITKFQELYNVNILLKHGFNQASIAQLFDVSSGRAYYMIKNAKDYKIEVIKSNLSSLNDLDLKIKTGKIDQDLGLELYFLK